MAELVYGSRLTEAPLKSSLNISWGLRVRIPLFKLVYLRYYIMTKNGYLSMSSLEWLTHIACESRILIKIKMWKL